MENQIENGNHMETVLMQSFIQALDCLEGQGDLVSR